MALDDLQMPSFQDPDGTTYIWDSGSKSYVKAPLTDKRPDIGHATGGDNDLFDPFQHSEKAGVPELEGYMAKTQNDHECATCGAHFDPYDNDYTCPQCGTLIALEKKEPSIEDFEPVYDEPWPELLGLPQHQGGEWAIRPIQPEEAMTCPFCNLDLQNGVCPRCGRTSEELHWTKLQPPGKIRQDPQPDDPRLAFVDEPPFPKKDEVKCPNCGETTPEMTCPTCQKDLTPEWNTQGQQNEFFDAKPDFNDATEHWTWPQKVPTRNPEKSDDSFPSMSISKTAGDPRYKPGRDLPTFTLGRATAVMAFDPEMRAEAQQVYEAWSTNPQFVEAWNEALEWAGHPQMPPETRDMYRQEFQQLRQALGSTKTAEALSDGWDDVFAGQAPMRTEAGRWVEDINGQLHVGMGNMMHEQIAARDGFGLKQSIALGSVYNDGTADVQQVYQKDYFDLDQIQHLLQQVFGQVTLSPPLGLADFDQKGHVFPPTDIQGGQWFIPPYTGTITGVAWVKDRPEGVQYKPNMIMVAEHLQPDDLALWSEGSAAIITAMGGAASHAAYLAMTQTIPVIVGIGDSYNKVETGNYLKIEPTSETITVMPGATSETPSVQKHEIWNNILDYQRQRGGSVRQPTFSHFHEELAWKEAHEANLEECPECQAPMFDRQGEVQCGDCGHKQPIIHSGAAAALPLAAEAVAGGGEAAAAGGGMSGIGGLMTKAMRPGFGMGYAMGGGGGGGDAGGGGGASAGPAPTPFDPNAGTVAHAAGMQREAIFSEIWGLVQNALQAIKGGASAINWDPVWSAVAANPIDDVAIGGLSAINQHVQNQYQQATAAAPGIPPAEGLEYYTPDEVAETLNVSQPTAMKMWDLTMELEQQGKAAPLGGDRHDPYGEFGPPMVEDPGSRNDVVGEGQGNMVSIWDRLTPEEQQEINAAYEQEFNDQPRLSSLFGEEEVGVANKNDGTNSTDEASNSGTEGKEEQGDGPEQLKDVDGGHDSQDSAAGDNLKSDPQMQDKALKAFHMNLPLVIEFAGSDEAGSDNPILAALDQLLEQAFPGYKGGFDEEAGATTEHPQEESETPEERDEDANEPDPKSEGSDKHEARILKEGVWHFAIQGGEPSAWAVRDSLQAPTQWGQQQPQQQQPSAWAVRDSLQAPTQWGQQEPQLPAQPLQGGQPEAYSCMNCGEQHEFPSNTNPRDLPTCPQCGEKTWTHSGLPQTYAKEATLDPSQMGQPGVGVPAGAGGPAMQICPRCGQAHTAGAPCPVADVTTPLTTGEPTAQAAPNKVVTKWRLAMPSNVPASQPQQAAGAPAAPSTCPTCGCNHIPGTPCPDSGQMQQPGAGGANTVSPPVGPGVAYSAFEDHLKDLPEVTSDANPEAESPKLHDDDHSDYHSDDDWKDDAGTPLQEGSDYELKTAHSPIPDRVTIEHILPEKLTYLIHSGDVDYRDTITRDQLDLDGAVFSALDNDHTGEDSMDTFSDEEMPPRPGDDALPQQDDLSVPNTTVSNFEPVSLDNYTGSYTGDAPDNRSWLMEDSSEVAVDPGLMEKLAAKNYSPREQREFIEEKGTARNLDRLDLEGTHYIEDELGTADSLW